MLLFMGLIEKLMALLVSISVAAIAKFAITISQLLSNFWRKGKEVQLRRAWVYHSTNDANE